MKRKEEYQALGHVPEFEHSVVPPRVDIGVRVGYFGFRNSCFRFHISIFGFQNGFGTGEGPADVLCLPVSGFGFRVSGFGYQALRDVPECEHSVVPP